MAGTIQTTFWCCSGRDDGQNLAVGSGAAKYEGLLIVRKEGSSVGQKFFQWSRLLRIDFIFKRQWIRAGVCISTILKSFMNQKVTKRFNIMDLKDMAAKEESMALNEKSCLIN